MFNSIHDHLHAIEQRLERNIFPWLGSRPLDTITPSEVLEVLRRIEARGANETAHCCRSICSQIFRNQTDSGGTPVPLPFLPA
ncbi:MAG: hypothetical protein NW237_16325 [Cyanobacteriota bacterium]|nr:hypothetical protein [Cyanobacteriota bacterium]